MKRKEYFLTTDILTLLKALFSIVGMLVVVAMIYYAYLIESEVLLLKEGLVKAAPWLLLGITCAFPLFVIDYMEDEIEELKDLYLAQWIKNNS